MMQSISIAIIGEILARGRWHLIATILGFNLFLTFLFSLMRQDGKVSPLEPSWIVIHIIFFQVGLMLVGFALARTNFILARLYAYPISNRSLVACHMFPAMVLAATFACISALFLNATLDLHWPVLASTLFAATITAACQAAIWQSTNQFWRIVILTMVAGIIFLWHKARFGSILGQPSRMWTHVTIVELLSMLTIVILAYFMAIRGVARCRRGDDLPDFGIPALIRRWFDSRIFDSVSSNSFRFRSPEHAQFWFHWRAKSRAHPGMVGAILVFFFAVWIIQQEDPEKLLAGIVDGSGMLIVVGLLLGLVYGVGGYSNESNEMGQFVASRPITSGSIGHAILKAAATSLGMVWGIWSLALVAIYSFLLFRGSVPSIELPEHLGWQYFPIVILGSWLALITVSSILLTGGRNSSSFVLPLRILVFLDCCARRFKSSPAAYTAGHERFVGAFGLALFVGTLWGVRSCLSKVAYHNAPHFLGVLSLVGDGFIRRNRMGILPTRSIAIYILALGCLAWVVSPIALAPLAVALNRVR